MPIMLPLNLTIEEPTLPNLTPFPQTGLVHWTSKLGVELAIRHITPDDAKLLVELYGRLSPRTLELRFATIMINIPIERVIEESARLATLNHDHADALIALLNEDGEERIVAVARLAGADHIQAEFALLVRDDFQGHGVGSYMLDLLFQVALVRGLRYLKASVLAENTAMLRLIRRSGFPYHMHTSHGESDVTIYLDPTISEGEINHH